MENMVLLVAIGDVQDLFGISPETIVFALINTLLIVLAYRFFLQKKVMVILDKRKTAVKEELDAATAAKEKALNAEKEYNARLADSKAEADRIVSEATKKARAWEEEIVSEAKESAAQIRKKADEDIERERKRALNEVKNQITEIVIMAAGAVAEKEINESDNAALVESFLANAESVGG